MYLHLLSFANFIFPQYFRSYDALSARVDAKKEEFTQFEQEDVRIREELKHAKAKAKKLEKSIEAEKKKVNMSMECFLFSTFPKLLKYNSDDTSEVHKSFASVILYEKTSHSAGVSHAVLFMFFTVSNYPTIFFLLSLSSVIRTAILAF